MNNKEIYDLLNSGWIYCEFDPYFEDAFFSHVRDKKLLGRGYFVRKNKSLFDRLVSIGMPSGSTSYDSCVVMFLQKTKDKVSFIMLSLKESGSEGEEKLKKVSEDIFAKSH